MMEKQIEHSGDALGKLLKERLKRKKYLTELKSMVTDVVSERLHASAFFAASIVMTCIFLMLFIALWVMLLQRQSQPAYEPLSVLFVWAPVTVCSLVSAIVSWRLFLAKKTFTADKMRGLGAFLICMVIFCIALCIVMGFVAFFFGLYLNYSQSSSGIPDDMMILLENTIAQAGISMNDLQHGLLAEFLAVMTGIPAFLVVLFVLFVVMLVKTIGHINFLRNAVAARYYDVRHSTPAVWIFIFAGLSVIVGIAAIAAVGDWLSGLLFLLTGVYLILLAVFSLGIRKEERYIHSRLEREIHEIGELEGRIVAEYDRQAEQTAGRLQQCQETMQNLQIWQQQIMEAFMQRMNTAAQPASVSPEETGASEEDEE